METLQSEYNEKGQLDDKSYESLEKAGIPKSYVDAFINGQAALAKQQGDDVKAVVGGEESYNKIASWAAENMTEAEKKAYNCLLYTSPSPRDATLSRMPSSA